MKHQEQGNNTMSEMINQEKLIMSNFTQVENVIFDKIMPALNGNEFKVFMVIYRKTVGWNKTTDRISISQLMKLSNIKSNNTVASCLEKIEKIGLISVEKNNNSSNKITLNLDKINNFDESSAKIAMQKLHDQTPKVVQKLHGCSAKIAPQTDAKIAHTKENINTLPKQSERTGEKTKTEIADQNQNYIPNLNLPFGENLTALEIFEYLKSTWAFGSPLGEITNRMGNLAEITVLAIETNNWWNNHTKHLGTVLTKTELLEKIYASVINPKRMTATERLERYTQPKPQIITAPVAPIEFTTPTKEQTDPKVLALIEQRLARKSKGVACA